MRLGTSSASTRRRGRLALPPLVLALALLAAALFPASSPAPIHVSPLSMMYWTGGGSDGSVSRGWILGGIFDPKPVYSGEHVPVGLALDPARNRIYWTGQTDAGVGAIRSGSLDGKSAASTLYETPDDGSLPLGIGVWRPWNVTGGRLFWAQQPAGGGDWSVWSGATDGSEQREWTQVPGGPANAIVPGTTGQQLYWTNGTAIELGDTLGPKVRQSVRATSSEVRAVAVAGSSLFWVAAEGGDLTVYGGTRGGTDAEPLYEEEDSVPLGGLVVAGQRLYWTVDNAAGEGTVMSGNVEGTGSPQVFEAALGARFLAFLHPAEPTAKPTINFGGKVGQQLTCARGSWSEDQPLQSYFAAPEGFAFGWEREGTSTLVGESQTLTPTEPGYYRCAVFGTNAAGGEWSLSEKFRVLPAPSCRDSSLTTFAGTAIDASLPCAGTGPLTHSILSGPQHGKLTSFDQATGAFRYAPDGGFSGVDSFTYKAAESDAESQPATATIRISPLPEAAKPVPQPAPPSNRFRSLAPRLDTDNGTATLRLQVPGPGALSLRGKKVRGAHLRVDAAGVATLKVRPKPATRRQLVRRGRAKVRVVISFAPDGGAPRSVARTITLRLR